MIEVYEAGLGFERAAWSGEGGRCVEIQFADADVEAVTGGELQTLKLRTRHEVFDERVSSLVFQLAEEVLADMPSGPLYSRGLSLALLSRLHAHHAGEGTSGTSGTTSARALTADQKRRVADVVAVEYGSKLTLDRLADEARLSPSHFSRLFKSSFDMTPHEYVQRVRLDVATRALQRHDGGSIADIALRCGFASQSHMTAQMRVHLGATPMAVRRSV